jgi:hypothetical protein
MMAAAAKFRDDIEGANTTTGSSTAYALTSYQSFDSLAHLDGALLGFTAHATSGNGPTLNVDGLGAKSINVANQVNVPPGFLISSTRYHVSYDNANNQFLIVPSYGKGTTSNDNPSAGFIGEYVESEVLLGAAVSLSSAANQDVTSISLTAGDWDVWGQIDTNPTGGTLSFTAGWISTTSATNPGGPNKGAVASNIMNFALAIPIGMRRYALASTTTVYLSGTCTFTGNCSMYGIICARRRR